MLNLMILDHSSTVETRLNPQSTESDRRSFDSLFSVELSLLL